MNLQLHENFEHFSQVRESTYLSVGGYVKALVRHIVLTEEPKSNYAHTRTCMHSNSVNETKNKSLTIYLVLLFFFFNVAPILM